MVWIMLLQGLDTGMDFITLGMNYLLRSILNFSTVRLALSHILECFIKLGCVRGGAWILDL